MFPFHLVKSENTEFLLMKTQQVLNRSSKYANVRYRKNQVFLFIVFPIKTKKISTLFLRHLPRKTRYEI